jgi:hypothetical protein
MDLVTTITGIALIVVGLLFMLLGLVGLTAKVIAELPHTHANDTRTSTLDVDYGKVVAAILKAMADAPGYVLSLAVGLVVIYLGLRTLGVEVVPGTGGGGSDGASPSPATAPSIGGASSSP